MNKTVLAALLGLSLGALAPAQAQLSVVNIPALPPGKAAPATSSVATPAVSGTPATTATPAASSATLPAPSATVTTTPATDLPTVTTLPARGTLLAVAHTATLNGPAVVTAGEATTWDFVLTNKGNQAIKLQHGACDVRFEVLNAAGQVVRPDPKNSICTMQLVYTDVAPGEAKTMQKIRWEGKDAAGQPVPAGQYTLRARFNGGQVFSEVAQLNITVR